MVTDGVKKKVLVTGGAGFIGSHTIVELLEAGYFVIALDNLSNAASGKVQDGKIYLPPSLKRVQSIVADQFKQNLIFVHGSFNDKKLLENIFQNHLIFGVIHFGGFKAVGESKEFPVTYYHNNLIGTISLIKTMEKYHVKKLIFSSSATVYTEVPPDQLPYTEDSEMGKCTCAYASSKYFLECFFQDIAKVKKDWKIIALRYFNPVGAHHTGMIGEDPKGIPFNLMPYLAQVAVGRRKCLNVFGTDYPTPDGTGVRDYCHVVDISKGHLASLKAFEFVEGFRAYNLGTGKGTSVMEMVQIFEKVNGVKIPLQMMKRRPGDIPSMYCDPRRAEEELKWKAEKSVECMCADLWNFQKNNPRGYEEN